MVAFMRENRLLDAGGIFRDKEGEWVLGFCEKTEWESSLSAELMGIYRGISIIYEKSMNSVEIESDCIQAIRLIQNIDDDKNHPQQYIIREARALLQRTGATLRHISRSANQCADHLARLGAETGNPLLLMETMPVSVREFWIRDKLRITEILD